MMAVAVRKFRKLFVRSRHVQHCFSQVCSCELNIVSTDGLYSSVPCTYAGGFAIGATSGAVTVQTASVLDRETTSSFTLIVVARDQAAVANDVKSVTVTLLISLSDVNDNAAHFAPSDQYTATPNENVAVGTSAYSGSNAELTYTIITGNTASAFYIVPILDRETIPLYTLIVTATDGAAIASDRLTSTATVLVTVTDDNDNPPVCQANPYAVTKADDMALTTVFVTVTCTEADSGVNSRSNIAFPSEMAKRSLPSTSTPALFLSSRCWTTRRRMRFPS